MRTKKYLFVVILIFFAIGHVQAQTIGVFYDLIRDANRRVAGLMSELLRGVDKREVERGMEHAQCTTGNGSPQISQKSADFQRPIRPFAHAPISFSRCDPTC